MSSCLKYEGNLPVCMPTAEIKGICLAVFTKMFSNDAIADLSLPPREALRDDFEGTMSMILFRFHKFSDENLITASLPTCKTTSELMETKEIMATVDISYHHREALSSPQLIKSRVLHEATHALRYAMIVLCAKDGVPDSSLCVSTPEKERADRQYARSRDMALFKLENSEFHAGYWMEHVINGGVWTNLTGHLLDDAGGISELPREGVAFKIIRKTEIKRTVQAGRFAVKFCGLEGCDEQGVVREILHAGQLITGCDDSEKCTRFM